MLFLAIFVIMKNINNSKSRRDRGKSISIRIQRYKLHNGFEISITHMPYFFVTQCNTAVAAHFSRSGSGLPHTVENSSSPLSDYIQHN